MTAAVRFHCQRPNLPAPARPAAAANLAAPVAEPYGNEIAEFSRAGPTLLDCVVGSVNGVYRNEEHLLIIKDEEVVTTYLEWFEPLWLAGREVEHAAGGFR